MSENLIKDECPECNPDPPKFWRDQPMNNEIRKVLTWSNHAIVYHYTLSEALAVWGNDVEDVE